jgi:glycerophosphoryl diester phosphodiesterase
MSANGIDFAATLTLGQRHAQPHLVAQRGNAAEFPENTLPALRSALELGIKHIEFDVHLAADRVPVVANNPLLATTANMDGSIFDLPATELAEVRACEPARFGNRFADVGIPTLAQAVELLATFPAATAFVDIQSASLQHHGYDNVIQRVCECLHAVRKQAVLIASDLRAVEFIRQRGGYRTGWIISEYTPLSALKCEAIAPDFLFCDQFLLPQDSSRLWRGPWRWVIGDVESGAQAVQLAMRGAAFVQTSEVRSLLRDMRRFSNRRETY